MSRSFLVTCAPPNPNGDLHLGHLAGPFLGGDVLTRYLRLRGHDVTYVSYTDDLSPFVLRKAEELGLRPEETAYRYGRRMEQTLTLADMLPDYYERPFREAVHVATIHEFFDRLVSRSAFRVEDVQTFWCETCRRHLHEAHVRGRCQFCRAPSDGFYCEECALPQDPAGLLEPVCIRCRHPPAVARVRRLVFPLARHRDELAAYFERSPWRPRLRDYCLGLVEAGLPDTPISRVSAYGVPVPLPGWEASILDTWYSGIFGYVAATRAYGAANGRPDLWRELWESPGAEIVHFIGFDCAFSHAVLWPALLLAHGGLELPRHVVTNEFYRLEGEKFSTSRGHAIWGSDFLREVPADALRFHLCLTNPEREQTTFRLDEFQETRRDVLVDGLQAWAERVFALLHDRHASVVPEANGSGPAEEVRRLVAELPDEVARHLEPAGFSPSGAARALADAIAVGSAASRDAADEADVAAQAELLAVFAVVSAPVLPTWSKRVAAGLGIAEPTWPGRGQRLVEAGRRVAAADPAAFHVV